MKKIIDLSIIVWVSIPVGPKLPSRVCRFSQNSSKKVLPCTTTVTGLPLDLLVTLWSGLELQNLTKNFHARNLIRSSGSRSIYRGSLEGDSNLVVVIEAYQLSCWSSRVALATRTVPTHSLLAMSVGQRLCIGFSSIFQLLFLQIS